MYLHSQKISLNVFYQLYILKIDINLVDLGLLEVN